MRIAHLADLHLGKRSYARLTPDGLNQGEADTYVACEMAFDDVIACRPDVVLIAGDVFHSARPSNYAILTAMDLFARLRDGLPGVPILVVAGNHDDSNTRDTCSPLLLFRRLGIVVADDESRYARCGDVSVLMMPHAALRTEREALHFPVPSPSVLLIHGKAEPMRHVYRAGGDELVTDAEVGDDWTYIAWGDYHVTQQVGPRAWYPGATAYTSSNIWSERAEEIERGHDGKAWLLVDLDTGTVERRPIPSARPIYDLPPIDGTGMDAPALMGALAAQLPADLRDAVVRQVVLDVPRTVSRHLDYACIREWEATALHYRLDCRPPEKAVRIGSVAYRRETLRQMVQKRLAGHTLPAGVDAEAFVAAGMALLDDVDDAKEIA